MIERTKRLTIFGATVLAVVAAGSAIAEDAKVVGMPNEQTVVVPSVEVPTRAGQLIDAAPQINPDRLRAFWTVGVYR